MVSKSFLSLNFLISKNQVIHFKFIKFISKIFIKLKKELIKNKDDI
jgi:hypothetical protein